MSDQSENRRQFLKTAGLGILLTGPLTALVNSLGSSSAFAADAGAKLEMIKPTDPQAQALGYYEDAKKVDTKKWPKRAGAAGEKQFCWNCMFYQAKSDPKNTKSAPCTIFAGKGVTSAGWCNSWTQNPAVKG